MKHVLVTGANGFIGRAVLPQLVAGGWQVSALGHTPRPAGDGDSSVTWFTSDLLDHAATRKQVESIGATHLLHLAWYTTHGKFWNAAENLDWIAASLALLRAFRDAGGKHAVMAGTCAEYDWTHGYCLEHVTPLIPKTLYGASKNALRMVAESLLEGSGTSLAWGRVFLPYGPGEAPARLVPSVVCAMRDGRPVHCSEGTQYRDFLHVDDVAAAFQTLLFTEASGCFNVSSGQPVTIREVVGILSSCMQWSGTAWFGALPARADDPPLLLGDSRKLRQLGWAPAIDLKNGLTQTASWWRNQSQSHNKDMP